MQLRAPAPSAVEKRSFWDVCRRGMTRNRDEKAIDRTTTVRPVQTRRRILERIKELTKRQEWNSLLGRHGGDLGCHQSRAPFGTSVEEEGREAEVRKQSIVQPPYDRYKPVVGVWKAARNRPNDGNNTYVAAAAVDPFE
jgi:hypothetical protein